MIDVCFSFTRCCSIWNPKTFKVKIEGRFQEVILSSLVLRIGWADLHQILLIVAPKIRTVFRYVVPFRNHSASSDRGQKSRLNFALFDLL